MDARTHFTIYAYKAQLHYEKCTLFLFENNKEKDKHPLDLECLYDMFEGGEYHLRLEKNLSLQVYLDQSRQRIRCDKLPRERQMLYRMEKQPKSGMR